MSADATPQHVTADVLVEYFEHALPYVTPIQINPKAGFTYPAALRSLMRHDPDVVLIG